MSAACGPFPDGASGESPSVPQPTLTRSTPTTITLRSLRFQRDIAHSGLRKRPCDDTAVGQPTAGACPRPRRSSGATGSLRYAEHQWCGGKGQAPCPEGVNYLTVGDL